MEYKSIAAHAIIQMQYLRIETRQKFNKVSLLYFFKSYFCSLIKEKRQNFLCWIGEGQHYKQAETLKLR